MAAAARLLACSTSGRDSAPISAPSASIKSLRSCPQAARPSTCVGYASFVVRSENAPREFKSRGGDRKFAPKKALSPDRYNDPDFIKKRDERRAKIRDAVVDLMTRNDDLTPQELTLAIRKGKAYQERFALNMAIRELGDANKWKAALRLLHWMEISDAEGERADSNSYTAFLISCTTLEALDAARNVWKRLCLGVELPSTYVCTSMIAALGRMSEAQEGLKIFSQMLEQGVERTIHTYTAVLYACSIVGLWDEALGVRREMESDGIEVTTYAASLIVRTGAVARKWRETLLIYEEMRGAGLQTDIALDCAMLQVVTNAGYWPKAEELFDRMVAEGKVTTLWAYNTYLAAMAGVGRVAAVAAGLERMRSAGVAPDVHSYTALMTAAFHGQSPEAADEALEGMLSAGVQPSVVTVAAYILAVGDAKWESAMAVWQRCEEWGFKPNIYVYSVLMRAACAAGKIDNALDVYAAMVKEKVLPNSIVFLALIPALRAAGRTAKAAELQQLQDSLRTLSMGTDIRRRKKGDAASGVDGAVPSSDLARAHTLAGGEAASVNATEPSTEASLSPTLSEKSQGGEAGTGSESTEKWLETINRRAQSAIWERLKEEREAGLGRGRRGQRRGGEVPGGSLVLPRGKSAFIVAPPKRLQRARG